MRRVARRSKPTSAQVGDCLAVMIDELACSEWAQSRMRGLLTRAQRCSHTAHDEQEIDVRDRMNTRQDIWRWGTIPTPAWQHERPLADKGPRSPAHSNVCKFIFPCEFLISFCLSLSRCCSINSALSLPLRKDRCIRFYHDSSTVVDKMCSQSRPSVIQSFFTRRQQNGKVGHQVANSSELLFKKNNQPLQATRKVDSQRSKRTQEGADGRGVRAEHVRRDDRISVSLSVDSRAFRATDWLG